MAAADYRLCDVCGRKAFYDAELNYDNSVTADDPDAYRIAGERSPFGMALGSVGDWAVLCRECATTHRTRIEPLGVKASDKVQLPDKARAGIEVLHRVVESLLTTSRYVDEEGEATMALADLSACIADPPFRLANGVLGTYKDVTGESNG